MTPFAAVLLAGGQSRRMGTDKALLPLADGRLLWERQLGILRALDPAELFISGARRDRFPLEVPCLPDEAPGRGPLAGISAALHAMRSPRLLVLAVDLPMMTRGFLHKLLELDDELKTGVVPAHPGGGYHEPLAAVYPKACGNLAAEQLQGEDWSLQSFVQNSGPAVYRYETLPSETSLFANWNEPADRLAGDRVTAPASFPTSV